MTLPMHPWDSSLSALGSRRVRRGGVHTADLDGPAAVEALDRRGVLKRLRDDREAVELRVADELRRGDHVVGGAPDVPEGDPAQLGVLPDAPVVVRVGEPGAGATGRGGPSTSTCRSASGCRAAGCRRSSSWPASDPRSGARSTCPRWSARRRAPPSRRMRRARPRWRLGDVAFANRRGVARRRSVTPCWTTRASVERQERQRRHEVEVEDDAAAAHEQPQAG